MNINWIFEKIILFLRRNGKEESGDAGNIGVDADCADVFSLAPFKLAPKKKKKAAHVGADGTSEKRRIHRYENLPAPDPGHLVSNSVYSTPSPEDLFGLVPFTAALTPRWGTSDPLGGEISNYYYDYFIIWNKYFMNSIKIINCLSSS